MTDHFDKDENLENIEACGFCGRFHHATYRCNSMEVDMEEEYMRSLEQMERDLDNYLE